MKKSKLLQKTINKLVEASFKDGKIVESQVVRSIKLLKSLSGTDAIRALSEYLKQLQRKERQHTMYIETVIPLSTSQIKKVKKIVERKSLPAGPPAGRTGRQVKITKVLVSVNPEILGGFRLKIGDAIWDESILGKINQVKEAIASGGSNQSN